MTLLSRYPNNVIGPITQKDWNLLGVLRKKILDKRKREKLSKLDKTYLRGNIIAFNSTLGKYKNA